MTSQRGPWSSMIAGAFLAAGVGIALLEFFVGGGLQRLSYDLFLVARRQIPASEVAIVYLDEESHNQLHQALNKPWDRALHARLIDRLSAAGAKAVVFDIVFSDPNPERPEADQQLIEAIRKNGRVVLAADHIRSGPSTSRIDPPFDLLREAAATIGSAEVVPDRDMVVRRHTPEYLLPSLGWATAEWLQAKPLQSANVRTETLWLNYYGHADFLPSVSYYAALDPKLVQDSFFKDKVVFVGARILTKFAGERKDEYRTPFTFWSDQHLFISGAEIQATAFLNLYRGDWLRRSAPGWERWICLLLGVGLGAGLVRLRPLPVLGAAAGVALAVTGLSYLMFLFQRVWFPWLIPVAQAGVALLYSLISNLLRLYVQQRLYHQTLARYLSPKLVRKFLRDPKLIEPGAEKQMLTIVFSDIAGFTTLSESLDSDALATLMNEYFERAVSGCIHRTEGTVGKYIGDGILAFWNAPDRQHDHAARACQAALFFREQEARSTSRQPLHTRIGIHTGVANVGNFGSRQRVDYTVLGENVNLASRLEGLNKFLETTTILSGDTYADVKDQFLTRFLGTFLFKGSSKPVEVHELIGPRSMEAAIRPWHESFSKGLAALQARDFDGATTQFQETLRIKPEDGPSKFYLKQIHFLRTQTLPETWRGEIEMAEK